MSAGGESKSPIVPIIITILIIGVLVGIFFPNGFKRSSRVSSPIEMQLPVVAQNVNPPDMRETDAYYTKLDNDRAVCGIKIFSPLPGQKVSFPLEVSGYVNGCGWAPFEGQVGTLEVRDENGSLAPLIILPVETDSYTLPAYFKVKINVVNKPTASNGVFIFHNENASGDNAQVFQLPVAY